MSDSNASYAHYGLPLIPSYKNKKFLNQSKILLTLLNNTSLKKIRHATSKNSVHVYLVNPFKQTDQWTYRLYVCVKPKDYWPVVSDLLELSQTAKFSWQFVKNLKHLAAPDKIAIFVPTLKELKKVTKLVRTLLKGRQFQKLNFSATTVHYGLEKKGEGLYVAADPSFIFGVCWLKYRWIMHEAIIKPNLKNGKIGKDLRAALKRLNISTEHNGPLKLSPDKRNNAYIEDLWKEISS